MPTCIMNVASPALRCEPAFVSGIVQSLLVKERGMLQFDASCGAGAGMLAQVMHAF